MNVLSACILEAFVYEIYPHFIEEEPGSERLCNFTQRKVIILGFRHFLSSSHLMHFFCLNAHKNECGPSIENMCLLVTFFCGETLKMLRSFVFLVRNV